MSCEGFEDRLVDLARGEELDEVARAETLAHAQGCLRCAARLEDERAVTSALRAFAARTAGAEPPARLEATLLRAMREPEGEAGGRARGGPSRAVEMLLLAAAAAIIAAIVVVPPRVDRVPEPGLDGAPAGSRNILAGRPGGAPAVARPAESSDFVALSYGEDLGELDSLQVVDVELPRTALAAFGLPAGEAAEGGLVKAEVIVGYDGVARAIRLVD